MTTETIGSRLLDKVKSSNRKTEEDQSYANVFGNNVLGLSDSRLEFYPLNYELSDLLAANNDSLAQVFEEVKKDVKGNELGRFFCLLKNLKEIETLDKKLSFRIRAWEISPFENDESQINTWTQNIINGQGEISNLPQVLFIGGASSDGRVKMQRFLVPAKSKKSDQPCYRYYLGSNKRAHGLAVKYMSLIADLEKCYNRLFISKGG